MKKSYVPEYSTVKIYEDWREGSVTTVKCNHQAITYFIPNGWFLLFCMFGKVLISLAL
jgi:hypothetical protein